MSTTSRLDQVRWRNAEINERRSTQQTSAQSAHLCKSLCWKNNSMTHSALLQHSFSRSRPLSKKIVDSFVSILHYSFRAPLVFSRIPSTASLGFGRLPVSNTGSVLSASTSATLLPMGSFHQRSLSASDLQVFHPQVGQTVLAQRWSKRSNHHPARKFYSLEI